MANLYSFPYQFTSNQTEYLYTKGKVFALNGVEYIGEYHLLGKVAKTGPIETTDSVVLGPYYTNPVHYVYDTLLTKPRLKPSTTFVKPYRVPSAYIPLVTETEYDQKFMNRYFAKNVIFSNSYITEISQEAFNNAGNNEVANTIDTGIYQIMEIKWQLIGSRDSIIKINKQTVINANEIMEGLIYTLPNMLQYARPNEL